MKKQLPDLTLCIIMDLIGCASYLIPFFGEFSDIIWAPLSGFVFYFLFGKKFGIAAMTSGRSSTPSVWRFGYAAQALSVMPVPSPSTSAWCGFA